MRHFSFRPSLTLSGREHHGLRGLSGKPLHAPLTDVPIAAYLFVGLFDILSIALRDSNPVVARQLYIAGLWLMLGAVGVSLLAALTGWADWHRSSEPGTQARRTINAHAITMIVVTVLAGADLAVRGLAYPDNGATPVVVLVLSILTAVLVVGGATIGGSLVFAYGFNVETAGDHPVWHHSEIDVFAGHEAVVPEQAGAETVGEQAGAETVGEQAGAETVSGQAQ